MLIAIGCDHRGLALKQAIITSLSADGHRFEDAGTNDTVSVDYPDIAVKVGRAVASGKAGYGILICGTGIGMCIAANKMKGIRAVNCGDAFCAERGRAHNNANVLCLGGEILDEAAALEIVNTFISTEFLGGRHQRRVEKLDTIE